MGEGDAPSKKKKPTTLYQNMLRIFDHPRVREAAGACPNKFHLWTESRN